MRIALIVVGVAMGVYGTVLLLDNPQEIIVRIVVWAVAAVVVHDFVFAPLCAAVGVAGRRIVRGRWWTPVSVAGLCTVVLALLVIPVYDRPGARPDNPTVLDRDYPLGLLLALAVVWACVPIYYVVQRIVRRPAARSSPVREDEAVEGERADHVERQPPTV